MSKWLFAASLCACGSPHAAVDAKPIDAVLPDAGECWPYDTATPTGSVELGITDSTGAFIPIPDDVPLEFGIQGGFDVSLRGRIHGLAAGNPNDINDPTNPRTLVNNEYPDTGLKTYSNPCPSRFGYAPDGGDASLEKYEIMSLFQESLTAADLFDKQFRVIIEVIDMNGGYAMDSKIVTVRAPPGWFLDAGVAPHLAPSGE